MCKRPGRDPSKKRLGGIIYFPQDHQRQKIDLFNYIIRQFTRIQSCAVSNVSFSNKQAPEAEDALREMGDTGETLDTGDTWDKRLIGSTLQQF